VSEDPGVRTGLPGGRRLLFRVPADASLGRARRGPDEALRLRARDNSALAGGVSHASTQVKIVPIAGPFRVTSQNTDRTIEGGNVGAAHARLMVEAVGNNFFDLSRGDLSIAVHTQGSR
jgi:hypothetical protein